MQTLGIIIVCFLIYILGVTYTTFMIRNDIRKKKYTERVKGMYLQEWAGPDKITKDRAIQFLIKVKEQYPDVSIDEMIKVWKKEGFIA